MARTIDKFDVGSDGQGAAVWGAIKTFGYGYSDGLNLAAIVPLLMGMPVVATLLAPHSDQWVGLKVLFSTLQKSEVVKQIINESKNGVFDFISSNFDDFVSYLEDLSEVDRSTTIGTAIYKIFDDYTYGTNSNDEIDGGLLIGLGNDSLFGLGVTTNYMVE